MNKHSYWLIPTTLLISTALYIWLLYGIPRQEFNLVIGVLFFLFLGYFYLLSQTAKPLFPRISSSSSSFSLIPPTPLITPTNLILAGMGLRLIALFTLPQLSDDYFRFVWDGRLLAQGINPFLQLPSEYMANPDEAASLGLTEEIYKGLNSKNYFTIYPPILQGIFTVGAWCFPNNLFGHVVIMKIFVCLAEGGTLWFLLQLLKKMGLPLSWVSIYALNPLVIVELTGNLHFEALMILGLVWCIWELKQEQWIRASIPFAIAVGSKLLPLMLLPLLIKRLGWGKAIAFGTIVGLLTGLMFLPIMDIDTFLHLSESVGLYFQSFEFNASLYYIVRWLGFQATGYNIIQFAGPWLGVTTILGILLLAWREQIDNLSRSMMWVFLIYFSLASIVHPWYSLTLVALCVTTRYRFPLIWTLLIPLSYATYRTTDYIEPLGLVAVEYVLLAGWIVWEVWGKGLLFNKKALKM